MPTLQWIAKDKIENHHRDVPFRILKHKYGFINKTVSETHAANGNIIIHGDNLAGLKSLLPEYEGRVNCIYIDPPYNTGNENWVYNDNVNDPRIRKWLGEVVGKEEEDLSRHDKWLCMMYPRLQLLYKLLNVDGIIFVSIDDHELAHLRLIMDEIFGRHSFVEYFCWTKTSTPPSLAKKSRKTVEYIVCYEKKKTNKKYAAELTDGGDAPLLNSGNPLAKILFPKDKVFFKIPDGTYASKQYEKTFLHDEIKIVDGYADKDFSLTGEFKWVQDTVTNEITNGTTFLIKSEKFSIRFQRSNDVEYFKSPTNLFKEKYFSSTINKSEDNVDTNEGAKSEIKEIFGRDIFDYPKPSSLIEFLLKMATDKNSIILDSFAGTGTTGHAVLNLNKKDGGDRKFILLEIEDYAETITAERIKHVIKGYSDKPALDSAFDYFELGETIFDENGYFNAEISLDQIRNYVYYGETRNSIGKSEIQDNEYFMNTFNDTAYYFYYKHNETTSLNPDFLATIKTKAEQYVIFADNCLLPKKYLLEHHIIFKKIPREISRF